MANTTYGSPYVQSSDLVSGWPATSLSVADRIDDVSFKGNGVNNQTATYTTVLTDAGKTIVMNVGSANDLTIQASGTAAYETGTIIRIVNKGSGATTVKPAGGVTLNGGNITLAQNQSATIANLATDVWSPVSSPANASGLNLIATGSGTGASIINITSCFSTTYDNYRVIITGNASQNISIGLRLLSGSTAASGTDYPYGVVYTTAGGASGGQGTATYSMNGAMGTSPAAAIIDIFNPFLTQPTFFTAQNFNGTTLNNVASKHNLTNSYDGLQIVPSTGTISASVAIYGYRKA
jgi:hypothetical protein